MRIEDAAPRVGGERLRQRLRAFAGIYLLSVSAVAIVAYGLRTLLRWGLR